MQVRDYTQAIAIQKAEETIKILLYIFQVHIFISQAYQCQSIHPPSLPKQWSPHNTFQALAYIMYVHLHYFGSTCLFVLKLVTET